MTSYYIPLTNSLNTQLNTSYADLALKDNIISGLQSNISTLDSQVADLSSQINNLSEQVNIQNTTIVNQSSQISSLDSQLLGIQSSYNSLQNDYSNYKASHSNTDANFSSLQANFSGLQTNFNNLHSNYSSLLANYSNLQTNNANLMKTYTDLNHDYNILANSINPVNITFGANSTHLNASEIQTFTSIISRINVYNPSPNYTGLRTLQWVSMRNSSSAPWDPYMKSMEFLLFQPGQGADGEWQAVLSIYNVPNSTSDYVVEVSRFTWWEMQVKLDGNVIADFPQVASDNAPSLSYMTFHVSV
jgi:peptidoglycan hydrolase CwlO-like protein